jgi:alpha-amylase
VARVAEDLGFEVLLGEGSDGLLGARSPARVYGVEGCERLRLLLRHYRLSDDIAFRFSNHAWAGWPLTAEKFAKSVHDLPASDDVVGLFMDYETFGEHQWKETGIFEFLAHMPAAVLSRDDHEFATPSDAAKRHAPAGRLSVPHPVSWADAERDLSAWLSNPMQRAANLALYGLLPAVKASGRAELLDSWRRLSTSDHLYYMCTKRESDGDVHDIFTPYATPHDAFIAFMNVLDDLERRVTGTSSESGRMGQSQSSTFGDAPRAGPVARPPRRSKRSRRTP